MADREYTAEEIIALDPCKPWPEDNGAAIRALMGGADKVTAIAVVDVEVTDENKTWFFAALSEEPLWAEWMEFIVIQALTNYCLTCQNEDIETWAQNWIDNVDRDADLAMKKSLAARPVSPPPTNEEEAAVVMAEADRMRRAKDAALSASHFSRALADDPRKAMYAAKSVRAAAHATALPATAYTSFVQKYKDLWDESH